MLRSELEAEVYCDTWRRPTKRAALQLAVILIDERVSAEKQIEAIELAQCILRRLQHGMKI